jgi:photosystem II stability/assembly factor-like uncharacterized protein
VDKGRLLAVTATLALLAGACRRSTVHAADEATLEWIGESPNCEIRFASPAQAWCFAEPPEAKLWSTGDSGRTWKELPLPFAGQISEIFGIIPEGDRTGSVLLSQKDNAEAERIYRTSDAGRTWQAEWILNRTEPAREWQPRHVYPSDGVLWLGGYITTANTPRSLHVEPAIHSTRDGDKFKTVALHSPDGADLSIDEIRFGNNGTGLAVSQKSVFYTTDNGQNWSRSEYRRSCVTARSLLDLSPARDDRSPISAARPPGPALEWRGGTTASLLFSDGPLLHSEDSGRTWCEISDLADQWRGTEGLPNMFVHFDSDLRGLVVNYGQLHETTDGGRHWTKISGNLWVSYLQCFAAGDCRVYADAPNSPDHRTGGVYRLSW